MLDKSLALQKRLESNLKQVLPTGGLTMFIKDWKEKVTPLGRRICQLAARERPIEDSGYSGWLTPRARGDAGGNRDPMEQRNLEDQVKLTGWPTPIVQNSKHATASPVQKDKKTLDVLARMALWGTPTSRDWKDGATTLQNTPVNALLGRQVLGVNSNGSHAQTENQGRLNPAFSRWLMGYPKAWCEAAIEAWHQMPINRRKRAPCD